MNKRRSLSAAAVAFLLTSVGLVCTGSPAVAVVGDGWKQIGGSGDMVLAIGGSSDANGARVIQWPSRLQPSGQAIPDQDWLVVARPGGTYTFRNAGTPDWKAMAVPGGEFGTRVIQYTYIERLSDQQWRILYTDRNRLFFQLANVETGTCLTFPNGTRGAQAFMSGCNIDNGRQIFGFNDN